MTGTDRFLGDLLLHRRAGADSEAGDKIAVVEQDRALSFRELNDRVNRFAHAMRHLGVEAEDRVAFLGYNSLAYVEAYCCAAKGAFVLVPLNFRLTPDEIALILKDSGARVLMVGDGHAGLASELKRSFPSLRVICCGRELLPDAVFYEELLSGFSAEEPDFRPSPDTLLFLMYTSGTTGLPKGVRLTHGNNLAHTALMARVLDLGEDEMTLHVCPFFHIAAVWMILIHLSRGCTNVILPKFEPEAVYQALSRYPITNLNIVPTMLFDLVRAGGAADYRQRTLRLILYGAAPMPDATFRKGTEVFGSVFAQIYGLTEASPVLTWLPKEDHALEGPLAARLRSCGRAVPGVEVAVVDELGRSLGPGEVGEIVARGATVFPGYWKNPDATSAAIHNGWLRTGDLARRDEEGYIYLVDRKKDMIISGGENIYCREIEAVLERHPVVEEVAVVGLRDERWGEVPQAWIVPSDEPLPLAEELQSWCDARLARFKVPKSFRFVSSLPKGPSGKVLKKEIRSWQQAESA